MQQEIKLTPGQDKYYGKINERLNRLKGEIISIFLTAAKSQQTHEYIMQAIKDRVFSHTEFFRGKRQLIPTIQKLPRPYRNEINGYIDACYALHMQTHIIWVLYYDGKFIGNSNIHRAATEQMYKQKNFDNSKVSGKHVYKSTGFKLYF